MTTLDTAAPATSTDLAGPGRRRLVAVGLGASAVTIAGLVLAHPWGPRLDSSSDDVLSYDGLAPYRDAAWNAIVADGLASALLCLCLALAACHLVRARGRVAATVGAVITTVGGALFAMGALGFVQVVWFATGVPEESSAELVSLANDSTGHLLGVDMAGFLLMTVGWLVLGAALVRGRVIPLAALMVFVALTIGLFLPIPGRAIDVVQAVQVLAVGALAVPLWRRAAS